MNSFYCFFSRSPTAGLFLETRLFRMLEATEQRLVAKDALLRAIQPKELTDPSAEKELKTQSGITISKVDGKTLSYSQFFSEFMLPNRYVKIFLVCLNLCFIDQWSSKTFVRNGLRASIGYCNRMRKAVQIYSIFSITCPHVKSTLPSAIVKISLIKHESPSPFTNSLIIG